MHHGDALTNKRGRGAAVPSRLKLGRWHVKRSHPHVCATEPLQAAPVGFAEPWVNQLRILPVQAAGTALSDSTTEQPPLIGRADIVAFALIVLLVISVVAVLYVAKAFFLPVLAAFVVGTMLSPAAGFLERHKIPRAVAAVLIVSAVGAGATFVIGLISSPLMEWSTRLPELGVRLRDKLHVFDRPLALWHELQSMLGGSDTFSTFQMPKFDWVQPAVEFLSPTFTEFLLFFATLILFLASWRDLRRALIMNFTGHDSRLRALRTLNT